MKKLLFIAATLFVAFPMVAMRVPGMRAITRIPAVHMRGLATSDKALNEPVESFPTDKDLNELVAQFPGNEFEKVLPHIKEPDALKNLLSLCEKKASEFESEAVRPVNGKYQGLCIAGMVIGAGCCVFPICIGFPMEFWQKMTVFSGAGVVFALSAVDSVSMQDMRNLNQRKAQQSRISLMLLRSEIEQKNSSKQD